MRKPSTNKAFYVSIRQPFFACLFACKTKREKNASQYAQSERDIETNCELMSFSALQVC